MKKIFIVLFALSLAACSTLPPPTSTELANANFGAYPKNYKSLVEARIKETLFDEDSAKFRYPSGGPQKTYEDFDTGRSYGYGICLEVNAKNRMGGYVGYERAYAHIKNGKVISSYSGDYASYICDRFFERSQLIKPAVK